MTSSNSVDISSLTTRVDITKREKTLLARLEQLFDVSTPPPNERSSPPDSHVGGRPSDPPPPSTPEIAPKSSSMSTSIKYALFALCSVCIQFALHYVSIISDTINGLFHDSSHIIKSVCLFLLAYVSYKHIDRFF